MLFSMPMARKRELSNKNTRVLSSKISSTSALYIEGQSPCYSPIRVPTAIPECMNTVDYSWHILSIVEICCDRVEYLWVEKKEKRHHTSTYIALECTPKCKLTGQYESPWHL